MYLIWFVRLAKLNYSDLISLLFFIFILLFISLSKKQIWIRWPYTHFRRLSRAKQKLCYGVFSLLGTLFENIQEYHISISGTKSLVPTK